MLMRMKMHQAFLADYCHTESSGTGGAAHCIWGRFADYIHLVHRGRALRGWKGEILPLHLQKS